MEVKKESNEVKLSSTGQEALKNAEQKVTVNKVNPVTTAPSGYAFYTKPQGDTTSGSNLSSKPSHQSIPKPPVS